VPPFVDTHCHLDHHDELVAADQVQRARAAGVGTMITVGTDMASSTQAVRTAHRFDGVWAVVGIHPNDAMEATDAVLKVIGRLAEEADVVGIGETGLDYYRDHTTPEQQADSFRAHIDLAREHDKTLVIHCREAWDDCLAILDDHGAPERVVMHCFSGDEQVVDRCAEQGWFMSFAGNVTFRNAAPLRAAAARAPRELLLTETDSPFLTPHPHRGERNDPSYVPLVAAQLAELHDLDVDGMAAELAANARRAFGLPDPVSQARAS
jgi:TatD DNase family protein